MVNTQRAVWLSYALTTIFNCNLSLLVLFIPLYGLFLGVSLPSIGLLIAIPGFLQLCITLICGGLIDKWGEKTGYLLTYSFGVMAAVIFNFTNDFTLLAVAQVCNGLGRAFFWTSSQSYASRIPGTQKTFILGRLNGCIQFGRMSGILLGGVMIQALGYRNAFLVLLGIVTVGWFLVHFLPPLEKKTTSMVASFHHLPELIKERPLQLATVICFFSALLLALTESFFPIWFKDLGFTESMIGVLVTFRGVGGIISSLLFGRLSQLLTKERLFQMCTVLAGLVLMPIPFIGAAVPLIIGIAILVGAATSIGSVLYISMVAEHSSIQNRGIAMALAGTAWSLAYAIGPVPFSQLADLHGVANAFLAVGLLFLITGSFAKFFFHKILSAHPKMR